MLLLQPALFSARAQPVSYSEFQTLVGKGKVSDLVLDQQTIGGSIAVEGLEGYGMIVLDRRLRGQPDTIRRRLENGTR